jgi:hypothetical protein
MAPKAAQQRAQKKAAKQKKILIALSVPMLAALIYAYMTFSSLGQQPAAAATPAGQTSTAGATGATGPLVSPGVSAPTAGSLTSFIALGRKDPFHDGGPNNGGSGDSGKSKSTHKGGSSNPKTPPVPITGAVISINGTKLSLAIGNQFGHAPGLSGVSLFKLTHLTAKTAVITVVGTTQQFTLHVRVPLTLEQNGGWTYTLILEPLGSSAPMKVSH